MFRNALARAWTEASGVLPRFGPGIASSPFLLNTPGVWKLGRPFSWRESWPLSLLRTPLVVGLKTSLSTTAGAFGPDFQALCHTELRRVPHRPATFFQSRGGLDSRL